MIFTAKCRIPSSSHNADSDEQGQCWLPGQQFKLLPARRQAYHRQTFDSRAIYIEQIDGEEVVCAVKPERFPEWFGAEAPIKI